MKLISSQFECICSSYVSNMFIYFYNSLQSAKQKLFKGMHCLLFSAEILSIL